MAKDSPANFFVQLVGSQTGWLAAADKVEGNVISFGVTIMSHDATESKRYVLATVGTTDAASNDGKKPLAVATTMEVAVARTLVNTMDVGMIEFTLTKLSADFDKNGLAFITFPTYYNPTIGDMMRCAIYDTKGKKDVETVYCAVAWDYTLKVMGPATAVAKASVVLRVYGVSMNAWATA
jgi:hypothetical protein